MTEQLSADTVVTCDDVVYVFTSAAKPTVALQRVHLTVLRGETVAVTGPSGSGKSTLLGVLSGALTPSAGEVSVLGGQPGARRDRLRSVGVMVQSPIANLLPYATAAQNVEVVLRAAGQRRSAARARTDELLQRVGLDARSGAAAVRLSGGEQQRLALAVALAPRPRLLLCDEPTSQQDAESAAAVAQVLQELAKQDDTAVVAVTHDDVLSQALDRAVVIRDGILGAESRHGREVSLVRPDGTVQLPAEVLRTSLPAGSSVQVEATPDGAVLRRVEELILGVEDVSIALDGKALVEHVSFTAQAGDRVGVVGRSGSGKTTLLRAIAGVLPPTSGSGRALA